VASPPQIQTHYRPYNLYFIAGEYITLESVARNTLLYPTMQRHPHTPVIAEARTTGTKQPHGWRHQQRSATTTRFLSKERTPRFPLLQGFPTACSAVFLLAKFTFPFIAKHVRRQAGSLQQIILKEAKANSTLIIEGRKK